MKQTIYILLILFSLTSCNSGKLNYSTPNISGEWVYRSILNISDENIPFCSADSTGCNSKLEFATAVMKLNSTDKQITGELDMGEFGKLILKGEFITENSFKITGTGIQNTSTQGWIYDYLGYTIPKWEFGVDQKETLAGSVIRTADHGNAKKGKVASFYLVKK
jgi:hypothetical protein